MDSEPLPSNAPLPETAPPETAKEMAIEWGSSDLSMLKNKVWWQNAALFSWYYAPHCIKPAVLYFATIAGAFAPIVAATLILTPSTIQLEQLLKVGPGEPGDNCHRAGFACLVLCCMGSEMVCLCVGLRSNFSRPVPSRVK